MNNKSIVRQLKIDLITDTPNDIITWFNDLLYKMYITETDVYHSNGGEFIYYTIIDGVKQWIFYRDIKEDKLWCNYNKYWSVLDYKFKLDFYDILGITKVLVENFLNTLVIPDWLDAITQAYVENALNDNSIIPFPLSDLYTDVEIALEKNVTNPNHNHND